VKGERGPLHSNAREKDLANVPVAQRDFDVRALTQGLAYGRDAVYAASKPKPGMEGTWEHNAASLGSRGCEKALENVSVKECAAAHPQGAVGGKKKTSAVEACGK